MGPAPGPRPRRLASGLRPGLTGPTWLRLPLLGAVLLAAALGPVSVDAKVQEVRLRLGANGRNLRTDWHYVGKFGYGIGRGSWAVRIKERFPQGTASNTTFSCLIYLDDDWDQVEAEPDACKKEAFAKMKYDIRIGDKRAYGPEVSGNVRQSVRPHIWYFAISDCNRTLGTNSVVVTAEITALNPDDSHFSVESKWAPAANLLTLVACTAFLGYFGKRSMDFNKCNGSVHPVIWTLLAVLLTQYIAQMLHTGHLQLYRLDGRGSLSLEIMSEIFFVVCQIIQTSLLILIASGYTLLRGTLGDLDVVLPICFMVAVVHTALVIADKMQVDTSSKFTDHDGWKGLGFALLRLLFFAWFILAGRSTSEMSGMRIRCFLKQFQVIGSFYFLSYPVLLMVIPVFAPYVRKPIMEMCLMVVQVGSNAWLAHLFLSRGAFFEVSALSASPLPGGSPVRFFKDE